MNSALLKYCETVFKYTDLDLSNMCAVVHDAARNRYDSSASIGTLAFSLTKNRGLVTCQPVFCESADLMLAPSVERNCLSFGIYTSADQRITRSFDINLLEPVFSAEDWRLMFYDFVNILIGIAGNNEYKRALLRIEHFSAMYRELTYIAGDRPIDKAKLIPDEFFIDVLRRTGSRL